MVSQEELRAQAEQEGYTGKTDPAAAWVVDCLQARGIEATYDDASGNYFFKGTVDGDLRGCFAALAANLP